MNKNNKINKPDIIFPDLNMVKDHSEREIVQIFLQRFRDIPFPRDEMRVMQAIEKTANLTGYSDGVIAKILVDSGLRSSRISFPQEFLSHIDLLYLKKGRRNLSRKLKQSYADLKDFWQRSEENKFSFMQSVELQKHYDPYVTV